VPSAAAGNAATGAARWPLIATAIGTVVVAVAGGVLFAGTNSRIGTLKKTVEEQAALLDEQAKLLEEKSAQAEELTKKLTGVQTDLTATTAETTKLTADIAQLMAAAKEQEVVATELESEVGGLETKLDEEAKKQIESQKELAELQGKATKLRGEIVAVEEKITAELATKAAGFDARVAELRKNVTKLESDYQTAIADTKRIEGELATVQSNITTLTNDILAVKTKIPDTKPIWTEIAKLEKKLTDEQAPIYKSVLGENGVSGDFWVAVRLDTRNGNTFFRKKTAASTLTPPTFSPSPSLATFFTKLDKPGRFDISLTYKPNGDVYDVVLLDSHNGTLWRADLTASVISWTNITNWYYTDYGANNAWRIDVDSSNASAPVPRILLTNTRRNFTYADDFIPRVTLTPLF
jgi:predicted  nucleic acid-binding Zn-ribbon protein